MRKTKKLLIMLALSMSFAATAGLALAKNATVADGNQAASDVFEDQEESLVKLRLESRDVRIAQYESATLSYTVSGTTEKVTFTSSDEAVATVDENGNVAALTLGETTITVSVSGVTATCKVTVVQSQYVPQIILQADNYTIENGDTLTFSAETVWGTTAIADATYSVSKAEDSLDTQAVVGIEGNVVTVESKGVETINVIVSTEVRGIYTSEKVTVKVVDAALKIQALSTEFKPVAGQYETLISTTDQVGDMVNSIPLNFVVKKGNTVVEDATIDWSPNSAAIAAEDGNLVCKGKVADEETPTLTGTVTVDGETATVKVVCNVVAPVIHLEDTVQLEIENLARLQVPSGLIGKIQEVRLHGKKINGRISTSQIVLNQKAFPKEAAKLGAQQLEIVTDLVTYTMDATIYTMIINDAAELKDLKKKANTGEEELDRNNKNMVNSEYYDGYFVLGNDIKDVGAVESMTNTGLVYTAEFTDDLSRGFRGVFDGNGYNIDGLIIGAKDGSESGGLFGYLSRQGIVRNVSFTNATVYANSGFICSLGDGTIENVSISYKQIGGLNEINGLNTERVRCAGSFFTMKAGANATVKNCLVDASAANIDMQYSVVNGKTTLPFKLSGAALNTENVITICPNQKLLDCSGADILRRSYEEVAKESNLLSAFDKNIWTTTEEGIPMFVNQAATLSRELDDIQIDFINMEETLIAGMEMLVQTNNPYVKIEINEIEGVSFENAILSATEAAFTQTVTVTATSMLNSEKKVHYSVYIDSFGKEVDAPAYNDTLTVYNTNPELKIGDETWRGEETKVYYGSQIIGAAKGTDALTLDLDALEWGMNNVTVVTVKNDVREHFTVDLKLWYTAGNVADAEVIADSAFSDYRGADDTYWLTDEEVIVEKPTDGENVEGPTGSDNVEESTGSDNVEESTAEKVTVPTGFEKAQKLVCTTEWSTALQEAFFSKMIANKYSDIWFALKIVNGYWNWQGEKKETEEWVTFHFVQARDNDWIVEVYIGDTLVKTVFDIGIQATSSTVIGNLLYGGGYGSGFLMYNKGIKDLEVNPTSIYATEIKAIEKNSTKPTEPSESTESEQA